MERFLQVADECDDVIAVCRHWLLGAATKLALVIALALGGIAASLSLALFG